ncbi:hypothetical protein CEE37_06255 [candidate division LCP-89 bacterium B3_LCP]|uniref:Gingipain R n=1 Tax=candidate division LCP-89 bacterium B3_LCP TaxID=2012998 RepID=A0A532V228_UNCL8|nr:MAG: hypothetical protein CEE37_06255 [candidate division LCP-89 bacterium B3_LCP]
MTRSGITLIIATMLLSFLNVVHAEYQPLRADVDDEYPIINLLTHEATQVQFEVRIPGIERYIASLEGRNWDRFEIPGGGYELDLGAPEVPHFSKLLAIPARTGIRAQFEALETTTIENVELMPAQGRDPVDLTAEAKAVKYDISAYSKNSFYPEDEVMVGTPAIMRDQRMVSIRMNPVRYNPVTKELQITHRYRVTVFFEGSDDRNVPSCPIRPVSQSWAKLMKASVLNFDELNIDITETGSYLIVCENNSDLLNNLLPPLIDWKMRKGHSVVVETFSPGSSNSTIKSIIQNAYDTWDVPPEFVLLFGDCTGTYELPGWTVGGWPWGDDEIDHPYSQLDGTDQLADVAVGRLPAGDDYEAMVLINKILFYEKMPYIANTDWYHEGVLIAGNSASGISTVQTNRYIKTRMIWNEYTEIDTFWYWMGGSVGGTLSPAINEGVSIANYRGCYEMENFSIYSINALYNGRKLPFVVTITCGTGGFSGWEESLMERFAIVGTPSNPSGAIACIGTATSYTHTRQNNTIDMGIFGGLFDEGITQAGNALNKAKLELYNTYWEHDPTSVDNFSKYAALAGDPGLELFNRAIQFMECDVPATVTWGENAISFTVEETGIGPLEDAIVCLYIENDLHEVGLTDASGQVTLALNPSAANNVKVTITKQNFYPIVDSLDVIQADVAVGYFGHTIDDDNSGSSSGNGDGVVNPGETLEIPVTLKNFGASVTATGINVTATVDDDFATLSDDYETFSDISPGATANSADDFDLLVDPGCPHNHVIRLDLNTSTAQGAWYGVIDLQVVSYLLSIESAYAAGSDTLLSGGETADFMLDVTNDGEKDAVSLTATITSLSPYVTVNDNFASFFTVGVGAWANCLLDPFNLTAVDNAPPGYPAEMEIVFTDASGATQTEIITIALGSRSTTDPQGPDEYGYWCFDNTDEDYDQCPDYNWIEIDPVYGGTGTTLAINDPYENADASVNVSLPFTFRYYGEDTDEITVCSNGWLSTWANNSFSDFRNYPIPSIIGPNGMMAPFWDDLTTWTSGHVVTKYDPVARWFIIEWSRMETLAYPYFPETFQVILYDPVHYPTTTGDGLILFQYNNIEDVYGSGDDNPYSTVGIESPDQQDGIEITYWNTYDDPATAPLANGRAYLFSTDCDYLVGTFPAMVIDLTYVSGSPVPAGGGNLYYGIWAQNQEPSALNCDIWIDIEYEGGAPTTIVQRALVNYQPGWTIDRPDVWFPVPGSYAYGNYEIIGRTGIYPNEVWNESGFEWSKYGPHLDGEFVPWVPDYVPDPFDEIIMTETEVVIPDNFSLQGAYPNPFNPSTTLSFALPEAAKVELQVFDISGRLVVNLIDGNRNAGIHQVTFDASGLASGVYICKLKAGSFTASQKMVLMK